MKSAVFGQNFEGDDIHEHYVYRYSNTTINTLYGTK